MEAHVRPALIVGDDFRFGAKRAGDFATLAAAGKAYGFEVQSLQTVMHAETRISSSAVRGALRPASSMTYLPSDRFGSRV